MHDLRTRLAVLVPVLVPVLVAALVAGPAFAQDLRFTVGFETMDGAPADPQGFASGDVAVLRVEVRNDTDGTLRPGAFWVAFPPVEGATLFGNPGSGFSFPDRMLDEAGNDVMVDHGVHEHTQLHELSAPLAPGAVGAIELQVTVLSSRNTLAGLPEAVRLLDADDRRVGVLVDASDGP